MSAVAPDLDALTLAAAARIMREALKDKTYQNCSLGQDAAAYLRFKRKRLTESSFRSYEATLDKLSRHFADLDLEDFEPPVGTRRLEEFLDELWGGRAARTYNVQLTVLRDFFKWAMFNGRLHGDPTLRIERARTRGVYRTTFPPDQIRAIIASQDNLRDKLAVRLLLDFGLRKSTLAAVQFKHFDHYQRRLTLFAKGGKVQTLPIPSPPFWNDLERLIIDVEARPNHYLMWSTKRIPRAGLRRFPDKPLRHNGLHRWWYGCLERAGVVAQGTTSGERMHKARHTAGQRVLNATGNLKAVQKMLGHASIQTTGDIYVDYDIDELAVLMERALEDDHGR